MGIVGNAVIQKDGTLILPQEVIQQLELKFGDELFFVAKGGEIAIRKLPDAMKRTVDYYLAIGCDRLAAEYYAGGCKRLTGVKAIRILRLPLLTKNEKNAYMTANRFWIRAVYLCIFGNMRTSPGCLLSTALYAGTSIPT